MNREEIREFQLNQLVLLDFINSYCKSNNLTYYIIGGTLLGAIRHKGFIPWDLDMDIAMPRKDYNTLINSFDNTNLTFFLQTYLSDCKHLSPHAILKVKNTHVLNPCERFKNQGLKCDGLYLDIFPLDNPPDNVKLQRKQSNRIHMLKEMLYYKSCLIFNNKHKIRNALKRILSLCIPVSRKRICEAIDNIEQKYDSDKSDKLVSMSSHYSYDKQLMDSTIYGEPIFVEFEGKKYCAPNKTDEYLTKIYGNYMEVPKSDDLFAEFKELTYVDERKNEN